MKLSSQDKLALLEQEMLALFFIVILSVIFFRLRFDLFFFLWTLVAGFALYFWMIIEENLHKTGKKHEYFEHTSSYIMLAQTALVLGLLFITLNVQFMVMMMLTISVILYSVSLSRVLLFKIMFPNRKTQVR